MISPGFDERRYLIPFRSRLLPQIVTDVLVIGSGVAGLTAALEASEDADVICVSKGRLDQSNTAWAQGGVASVVHPDDSIESHVADTLAAGAGLCDVDVVQSIISEGSKSINWLIEEGMPFDRAEDGSLILGREGAHSSNRILHTNGDATGFALAKTLINSARGNENIRLFDQCFTLDLITEGGPGSRCLGAITHHPKYGLQMIWAKATILASGGCGQLFRETTNPRVSTGDGIAMAYRAGAEIADVEFMQFHPTSLYVAGAARLLISEAVRGEGAHLVNRNESRFMVDTHELAELAPRDVVSRAIIHELGKGAGAEVYLDTRHFEKGHFAKRFPAIYKRLMEFDLNPEENLVPVRPAAHYMVGGLWVNDQCETNIEGLYACGEGACTGLHGANRLASNSLLEGVVCGKIAGRESMKMLSASISLPMKIISDIPLSNKIELDIADVQSSLRSVMWRHVGIERDGDRLEEVVGMFDFWARYTLDKIFDDRMGWEVQNQLLLGAVITRAALERKESRGTHYRIDHPAKSDEMKYHTIWTPGSNEPRHEAVVESSA